MGGPRLPVFTSLCEFVCVCRVRVRVYEVLFLHSRATICFLT